MVGLRVDSINRNNVYNNTQNRTAFKSNSIFENPRDSFCFSQNKNLIQPQKTQNKSKLLLIAGTLALGAVALYALTKGKFKSFKAVKIQNAKINELIKSGKLNEKYARIFQKTKHLEGESFVKKAYSELCKYMGYTPESAPKLKILKSGQASSCTPSKITIDINSFKTKRELFGTIRHELEHTKQAEMVYRAFGQEKYIQARLEPHIFKLKLNDEFCMKTFGKTYKELTQKEIQAYSQGVRKIIEPDCPKLEQMLKLKGPIAKGTPEYHKAHLYKTSMENYISPTMLVHDLTPDKIDTIRKKNPRLFALMKAALKNYMENPMEKFAKLAEEEIQNMYDLFV